MGLILGASIPPGTAGFSDSVGIADAISSITHSTHPHAALSETVGLVETLGSISVSNPRHPHLFDAVGITASLPSVPATAGQILTSISDASNNPYLEVTWSDSGSQKIGVNVNTGSGIAHYDSHEIISDLDWHSYAVALDRVNSMGTLYVDGRVGVVFPIVSNTWPVAGGKWFIGAKTDKTKFFNGDVDEFNVSGQAFDATTAYQNSTSGFKGITLAPLTTGGGGIARPTATIHAIASLIVIKPGPPKQLVASTFPGLGAMETVSIDGALTVRIPVAPISVPETWIATTTADAAINDAALTIQPLGVAMPAGALLYFPIGLGGGGGGGGGGTGIFGPGLFPNFSIETWIKPSSSPLSFPSIAGINGTNYDMMMLAINDNGGGAFVVWSANSSSSGWQVTSSPGSIAVNSIYHIVGTWDGTNAVLYINGSVAASTTSSEVIQLGQSEHFYAGSDQFGNAYGGVIDEIAFYESTLSSTRVTAHHGATSTYSAAVLADAPTLYWRAGELSGTSAHDATGNGNNGTYDHMPTFGVAGLVSGNADKAVLLTASSNQYIVSG